MEKYQTSFPGFELWTPASASILSLDHQSKIVISHKSILIPFRTTKDSFLPVTVTGIADLFPQLGSLHEQLCGDEMYLALMVQCQNTDYLCRGPGFESHVKSLIFSDILGRLG
jgi:hypothetical protein